MTRRPSRSRGAAKTPPGCSDMRPPIDPLAKAQGAARATDQVDRIESLTRAALYVLVLFMSDGATQTEEPAQARTERHLAMLRELAEIGMQIARAVRDEAVAGPADEDKAAPSRFGRGDPAGLFADRPRRAPDPGARGPCRRRGRQGARRAGAPAAWTPPRSPSATARKMSATSSPGRRGRRHRAPRAGRGRRAPAGRPRRTAGGGRYDDALADAPIAELVARICDDLGVTPDWRIWDDQDWAVEYLRENTPTDIGAERWRDLGPPPAALACERPDAPRSDSS